MRYVSILFLCLVFVPCSFATTYYVSLSGNDANDGSSGRPWRTIQNAAAKVPAGQGHTIQIAAGTFIENQIHVPLGVHLIGAGVDATIIKANPSFYYYPASPGFSNEKFLMRFYSGGSSTGNQSIKNFTIDGDGKKLHGGIFIHNRNNVVVENIKIQYVNFSGLWLTSSNSCTVKDIKLKDCAWGSSSWCSAALQFGNLTNLDVSGFDIDEGRGYGIKNLGHDQNAPLTNVKLHHGKVSVHQAGLWNGGSAPNITIEFWASGYSGTEIYNTYVDNHISIVNPNNTQSATPLKIYNNFFDILSPRTNGAGYCMELSSSSVEVRNNWFHGGSYGVVNWSPKVYSNWNIHHNVFYGLSGGGNPTSVVCSYKGGVQNLNLYNNTVELTSTNQAVHFVEFDNGSVGTNVNLKNNLIINSNGANKVLNLRNNASINNLQVTNNFFQNITQGTVPGNYSANATGTSNILRSGNKPQTFYNHSAGGNLIDKGVYVGIEGAPDIGACGDNNIIGTAGTSSSPAPAPTTVAVTGVSVSPASVTIGVNGTTTLTKVISPSNATNQAVTWSSSNAAIARVDATSGLVTGVAAGSATITVRTTDGAKTANATVTVNASAPSPGGNGVLTRAVWTGISGDQLSVLKSNGNYPNSPSSTGTVSSFAGPANAGDNYGTRIYGYLRPQATGSYTFWISSDDQSELYLSTDQNPANKTLIASVSGWSNPGELTRYPQQQSVAKNLVAGQSYYIEALHKEGTGGDHVSVYWQGPGVSQSVIGSAYISTTASSTSPTTVAVTGVAISPASLTLGVNATSTLSKTITPSNATNQAVTWSSSNAAIARVDAASGLVTGVAAGTATITVRTTDGAKTANATVTVTPPSSTSGGGVNGVLTRSAWIGIAGESLSALKSNGNYPSNPNLTSTVSSFAGPSNAGDNYGSRISGYIRPQTSGSYIFWIAGDDNCELYLSTDQNAANKTMIASLSGWSNPGELTRYPQQQSAARNLVAGQYYYIEALHKEGVGGDHVAVYWQGPGISQSIIGSAYISTAPSSVSTPTPVQTVTGGNGLLTRAVWSNLGGDQLSTLKSNSNYPNNPSSTSTVSTFAGPTNWADNYGSRIYGYIRPQTSGSYTFWITGDDNCELYLSTDQNAANKSLIANLPGWANPGELTRYPQQKSVTKNLIAGQYYFIEALHKEGSVIDHVAVYWQGPGITQSIIGSAYLSTTAGSGGGGGSPENFVNALPEESAENQFAVYPVPVKQGDDFTIELPDESREVKLLDLNGKQHRSVAVNNETSIIVSSQGLESGIYYFQVIHARGSEFKKVMVK